MSFNLICRRTLAYAKPYFKLQLRCNGLSSSSLSFSTTPSDSLNQHSFTVTYLINSCGLDPEAAILASRHVDLSKFPDRADTVLTLLKDQGFTETQVSRLILKQPNILLCDAKRFLSSNFELLNSIGLSKTNLFKVVVARPRNMFFRGLRKTQPSVNYLRNVLGSNDKVIDAITRYPLLLAYDLQVYAAENFRILRETGVPETNMINMFIQQPRSFLTTADKFRKVVEDVKGMGFDPSKTRFLWAVHARRSMSKSTWDKKVELYKKWGWSEDEIVTAFERYPGCMIASMDKIAGILDFLVNTMGWERSYIVQRSIVICFSLEKRVIPRCMVYQYLAEKGLIEETDGFIFSKWMMYTETNFLKWIVKTYEEEAPELLKLYHKHLNQATRSTPSILRKKDAV